MPTIEEIKAQLIANPTFKNSLVAPDSGVNYQVGVDKYNTYATPDPLYSKYLNQSNLQSFGNVLERGVVKFALSIPENAGYMVDLMNSNKDFDNGLSAWARGLKEQVDETFPEYSKMFEEGFDPGDADWWFRNGDSIIESAGYMVPGLAVGKGVGMLAKAAGATANIAKATGTVAAAVASNYAEGMQMAGGRYRQLLESGVSKEEAAKSAANIVNLNRFNLPLQVVESSMLLRGLSGATAMSSIGVKASMKDLGKQFLMEGFEEWNQGFIEEEQVRRGMIASGRAVDNGSSIFDRLKEYALSDDALTQAFIGGLGGVVMQGGNDLMLNADPSYRERKKQAFDTIGGNYQRVISLAENIAKKQEEKDAIAIKGDEIEFNLKAKEQALEVVMANIEMGTYSQFMKTFDAVLNMSEEEATAKGLDKAEMSKMAEILKPAINRMAKAYSNTEAEFNGKLPKEYIKEVAKQAYYSQLNMEASKDYAKRVKETQKEVSLKSPLLEEINKKASTVTALRKIVEATKDSKGNVETFVNKSAEKALKKAEDAFNKELETAKSVYDETYTANDWEAPSIDPEVIVDTRKQFEHQFLSEFHNNEYKTYSSKKKVEELQKKAEEVAETKKNEDKAFDEKVFNPVRVTFKSTSAIAQYDNEDEKNQARGIITSQYNSLKATEAYNKAPKALKDKLEQEYLKALKNITTAKNTSQTSNRVLRVEKIKKEIAKLENLIEIGHLRKYKNREKLKKVLASIAKLEEEADMLNQRLSAPSSLAPEVREEFTYESVVPEIMYSEAQSNEDYFKSYLKRFIKSLKVLSDTELEQTLIKEEEALLESKKQLGSVKLGQLAGREGSEELYLVKLVIANNEAKVEAITEELILRQIKSENSPLIILEENTESGKTIIKQKEVEAAFRTVALEDVSEDGRVFVIRGKKYFNLYSGSITNAINRNNKGEIISVSLSDENNKTVTFSSSKLVDEIAFALLSIEIQLQEELKKSVIVTEEIDENLSEIKEAQTRKAQSISEKLDWLNKDLYELNQMIWYLEIAVAQEYDALVAAGISKKESLSLVKTSSEANQIEDAKKIVKIINSRIEKLTKELNKPVVLKKQKNETRKTTRKPVTTVTEGTSEQNDVGESENTGETTTAEGEEVRKYKRSTRVFSIVEIIAEKEKPETGLSTSEEFVPTDKTMWKVVGTTNVRKKDNIVSAAYLGQEYEEKTDENGNVYYEDLMDEEGNYKVVSHPDESLNDYKSFTPGEELEIVVDTKYAASAGIPINEENIYRIPFGVRRKGNPVTMWIHKFNAPVGSEIDSSIKKLIREPKVDANGVVVDNPQEREQKRLIALREYLFANTKNNAVVKAKVKSRSTGYALLTDSRPSVNQLTIDGKVAEDVDFAVVVSGVIAPMTSELSVSTEGRRDDDGNLIYPNGSLLVVVPGFSVDKAGNPILESYYAQAHTISENDADVILTALKKGKPSEAWTGLGFEVPSFESFLSYFFYNGKNSGKLFVDIEKNGAMRNRYIYTTYMGNGVWDLKSRIRVWTNETNNPVTEKELQAAKDFIMSQYYNFPKGTKEYPRYTVKDGNLSFEGKFGYKEHIAQNTNTIIQGKRIGNTQRMQFFTQAVIDLSVDGFEAQNKANPLKNNKLNIKVTSSKVKTETVKPVQKTEQVSDSIYSELYSFKNKIVSTYKGNPAITALQLMEELPEAKEEIRAALRKHLKESSDNNVITFISELMKELKSVNPLELTVPLSKVNTENVRELSNLSKEKAYSILTTSKDEQFNSDMRNLLSVIKDFEIVVSPEESPYLGIADSARDRIYLYKQNIAKASRPVRTILGHEVVHLATAQALENPSNANEKEFAKEINSAYIKAKKALGKEAKANAKEFLAEFFSNEEFRNKLDNVEKGLLDRIINWIKELLGFSTSIESLVRDYTNTFVTNFKGYDRNFAVGSDPLYQEYKDAGISLSRREVLLSSLSGHIINFVQNGITEEADIKQAVKDLFSDSIDDVHEEVLPVVQRLIADEEFFDMVYSHAKQYVLKLDIGFDERENWQLDSRFEVNPWMTTSKQVRKFLAGIPEIIKTEDGLTIVRNEFGLFPYKNPIALHANLAETLSGKNVMEHLAYLSGENPRGIIYDPVKAHIYQTLLDYQNGTKEEVQIYNAFNTDFKKYKAEFISVKHKESVATAAGQVIEDENGLPQKVYNFDVYESNKTGGKTFLAEWYNNFLNRMTVDGEVNTSKAQALLARFNKVNNGKDIDVEEVELILNEFGITMSAEAIDLAVTNPKIVDKKITPKRVMDAIYRILSKAVVARKEDEVFSVNNPFVSEDSNLKILAQFEAQTNSGSFTSLFRTESGKNMYAVSNNSMLTYLEKELKSKGQLLTNLATDVYTKNSLLVKELLNNGDFDIKIFSEFVNLDGDASAIKGLTSQERLLVKLAMFNNRGEDTTLIQFPTLESKPVVPFIKAKRIHVLLEDGRVNDATVDLMFDIVKDEFNRIVQVRQEQKELPYEELVERYHFVRKNGEINKKVAEGLKFHLTPIMNDFALDGVKVADMSEEQFDMYSNAIKEKLKNYSKEIIDLAWEDLIRADIASVNKGKRTIKAQFLDSKVKNKLGNLIRQNASNFSSEEYVANFALNYYLRYADIYRVFGGDVAFTKGHVDMAKRFAMLIAPGTNLDIVKEGLTMMSIPDRYVSSPMIPNYIKVINYINDKYKDKGVKIEIESTLSAYKSINATDGQTWVSTDYKRDELNSLGRLDESTEELLDAADLGIDEAPKVAPIGSSKIVYAGKVWDGKKYITVYIKTSTNTLLQGVHNEELIEKASRADLVAHESAVKIGMRGLSEEGNTYEIPRSGLSQQQEITYHGDDTAITALSQARRMLTEGFTDPVFKDLSFNFQGKKLSATEFRNQFQKLHIAHVKEAWNKLSDKLGVVVEEDEGVTSYKITDYEKVRNLLLESGRLNDVEAELLQMKDGRFEIPLFFSPANERFESLLFSIISNRIMSLEQNGSSFVQVSQKGFDNLLGQKIFDLNELSDDVLKDIDWISEDERADILANNKGLRDMYFDGKKMKPGQILLPNVFKKYFVKGKDITIEDLRRTGLSEVFLMRSPYQLASGFNAEVIGFLPESAGEIIVVPNEAMVRIGFDFDVDKLYTYLHNAQFSNGEVSKVRYSTAEEELEYRYKEFVKGRIFDIAEQSEVLEEEKESLYNEFKETVKAIVKAKTDSVIGETVKAANDDFKAALSKVSGFISKSIKDIVYDKTTSLATKENKLAEFISSQKGNIQVSYKDLQKIETEYNNFVFNVNRRSAIEKEYSDLIRNTTGYDEMRKNLTDEVKEKLADLAISSGNVPMTLEAFAALPIEEQNSKKARENATLDQFLEVYSHPEIMYKLLTVNSEAPIQEAVDKTGRKSIKGSPLTMREQDRLFSAMKDSKTGISISSMWVTFQEVLQYNKVKLKIYEVKNNKVSPITAGIKFLNEKGKLHKDTAIMNDPSAKEAEAMLPPDYPGLGLYSIKTRGISQDLVGKYMLVLQTATVDNAKNQGMYPANLGDYTLPTALYLGAMGIDDFDLVVRFLTQPVIIEYVELMNNGFTHNKAIGTLFSKYGRPVIEQGIRPAKTQKDALAIKAFSSKELLDLINNQNRTVDYYNDQLEILNKWAVYSENAATLGAAATKANFDTKKLGKNYFDVQSRYQGYKDILSDRTFVNLDKIFKDNVIGAYVDYGVIPARTMFNDTELLPYHYALYRRAYDKYAQNVRINNGRFDDATRRKFNKNILAFIATYNNSIVDVSERPRLLGLPKEIAALKEAYPDNLLLSRIDVEPGKPLGKKYDTLTFRRVGLDTSEIKYMVQSFTELLDNPETRPTAERLIKYTLIFHGLAQSAGSLLTVIPPSYLLSSGFGEAYKSRDFMEKMNDKDYAELFFDQYAAHNPENFHYKYNKPVKGNDPTRLILTFEEASINDEGGFNELNIPEYIQMNIRVKGGVKTVAAKLMSENDTHVEYRALNPLGTTDFTEYSFDDIASVVNPEYVLDYTPYFRPVETSVTDIQDVKVEEPVEETSMDKVSIGIAITDSGLDKATKEKLFKDLNNALTEEELGAILKQLCK